MVSAEILLKNFSEKFGTDAAGAKVFFAPGRVSLIGEHIDYNGGLVLPATLSLGIYGVFAKDNSRCLKMCSGLNNQTVSIQLDQEITFEDKNGWANYPAGVIRYLQERGLKIPGGNLMFESDLPIGAGLSSSAAIEVLTGFIFSSLEQSNTLSKIELVKLCKDVENNFIGVQCGIMDQFAVTMGKKNHAVLLNCRSLEYEHVPVNLGEYSLLIFNTNKKRELTDSWFNQRVNECAEALESIKKKRRIENLADADEESVKMFVKNPIAKKRALHVVQENIRVQLAAEALKKGEIEKFGSLLFQSQESLKDLYEVTGVELDAFFDAARKHPACIGAKMSGAGFGGCGFAIVKSSDKDYFINQVSEFYLRATGLQSSHYLTDIEDGVRQIQ